MATFLVCESCRTSFQPSTRSLQLPRPCNEVLPWLPANLLPILFLQLQCGEPLLAAALVGGRQLRPQPAGDSNSRFVSNGLRAWCPPRAMAILAVCYCRRHLPSGRCTADHRPSRVWFQNAGPVGRADAGTRACGCTARSCFPGSLPLVFSSVKLSSRVITTSLFVCQVLYAVELRCWGSTLHDL